MLRRACLFLFIAPAPLLVPAGCAESDEPVRASIVTSFSLPRGALDRAQQLELRVLEGQVSCEPEDGTLTLANGAAGIRELAKASLGQESCPENVRFCGKISIAKSNTPRVFEAKARTGSNVIAIGCATATVDQDAVPVDIKMLRFVTPAVCGDGALQPTEQCEPAGMDGCDDECQSTEVVLSIGSAGNGTSTGKAGDKTDPFFLWPPGGGETGRFVALFTDHAVPAAGGTLDVGLRVMSDTLTPLSSPAALTSGTIFLPNGPAFPPAPMAGEQSLPQAAFLGSRYYVVFQGDGAQSPDILLRVINKELKPEGAASPLAVNGNQGEPGTQSAPAVAAGSDRLYVVWEDQSSGAIVGRTVTGGLSLGNQNQVSGGSGNTRPQVAATRNGWVAVWRSPTGIKLRSVDGNGTPSGGEQTVNDGGGAAEGGRVASLPDGRFAVVWSKNGDIFVQRYDARGVAIAGDQEQPVNDLVTQGEQNQPAIASTPGVGGSYVVAWRDARSGEIHARFLGGSGGFLPNNVNGDVTEFVASRAANHDRATPIVAVGGSAPFVAIGWEDKSSQSPGIVVRRFPIPSE